MSSIQNIPAPVTEPLGDVSSHCGLSAPASSPSHEFAWVEMTALQKHSISKEIATAALLKFKDGTSIPESKSTSFSTAAPSGGIYVAPKAAAIAKAAHLLVVTQGYLNALAAATAGLAAVALEEVGVWCCADVKPSPTTVVPESLLTLAKSAGRVAIVGARELRSGEKRVKLQSLQALASALRANGVPTALVLVPGGPGSFQDDDLSEWLGRTPAAKVFSQLSAAAGSSLSEAPVKSEGFVSLGTQPGGKLIVWSCDRGEHDTFGKNDIGSESSMVMLAGTEWCQANYPKEIGKANKDDFNVKKMGADIRRQCVQMGPWKKDRLRGGGVWQDGDNLLVNSREAWFASNGAPAPRHGAHMYLRTADLGITPSTQPASVDEVMRIYEFLLSFKWARGDTDARLMLGWITAAFVCAALKWRTHTFVHANPGSGKSTLLTFVMWLLSDACVAFTNANEAGVRQALGMNALAAILDESGVGASGKKLAALLEYFRFGSGGGQLPKGTQDHGGIVFETRSMGLLAGVTPPEMDPQDLSRFLMLAMNQRSDDAPVHEFSPSESQAENLEVSELGLKMFARTLSSWPRLQEAIRILRHVMKKQGFSDRAADTLSGPIAGAFVSLYDDDLNNEEDAVAWLKTFDIDEERERVDQNDTGKEFLNLLESTKVVVTCYPVAEGQEFPQIAMGELWNRVWHTDDALLRAELAAYGMAVDRCSDIGEHPGRVEVRINAAAQGFKNLFKFKRDLGNLSVLVARIPGASKKARPGRIQVGGIKYRGIPFLPYETPPPPLTTQK